MNRAWVMGVMAVCVCAAASGKTPRINGPTIYGVRPGSPIIYRLPVTGTRPLVLEAKGLPPGATFDAANRGWCLMDGATVEVDDGKTATMNGAITFGGATVKEVAKSKA